MSLKYPAFTSSRLDDDIAKDKRKVFPVSLNLEQQEFIFSAKTKVLLQQDKDSTIIRQLALIGAKLIHSAQIAEVLEVISDNKRKNKRMGYNEL